MPEGKPGDLVWGLCLAGIIALLAVPATPEGLVSLTNTHPFLMGFAKFAVLATMGELLSIRILSGGWKKPKGVLAKAVVWGLIGMIIVLVFAIYSRGVAGAVAAGLLRVGRGTAAKLLTAFFISLSMNLSFAPVFMAAHRLSDTYIDLRVDRKRPNLDELLQAIDWKGFFRIVLLVTIPAFWVPAHTVTFLLSPDFRVLAAALLSLALGVILAFARRHGPQLRVEEKHRR
jgi:hypothetical protein